MKQYYLLGIFILLILGFIFSLAAPSAVISYVIIFLCGFMAGRLLYERKNRLQFPYYLMVIGFLAGYLIGGYYYNKKVILTLFVIAIIISYYLHDKGIIHDIKF